MEIINAAKPFNYTYDKARPRMKYLVENGEKWINHGDLCEYMAKAILNCEVGKDRTPFDKGYDIPELKASVKSHKCGLTECKGMPTEPAPFLEAYNTKSIAELYIYVCDHGEDVSLYMMNHDEFNQFIKQFGRWDRWRNNFRITACNKTVEKWMFANLAA